MHPHAQEDAHDGPVIAGGLLFNPFSAAGGGNPYGQGGHQQHGGGGYQQGGGYQHGAAAGGGNQYGGGGGGYGRDDGGPGYVERSGFDSVCPYDPTMPCPFHTKRVSHVLGNCGYTKGGRDRGMVDWALERKYGDRYRGGGVIPADSEVDDSDDYDDSQLPGARGPYGGGYYSYSLDPRWYH